MITIWILKRQQNTTKERGLDMRKKLLKIGTTILALIWLTGCAENQSNASANSASVNNQTMEGTISNQLVPKEEKDYMNFPEVLDFGAYSGLGAPNYENEEGDSFLYSNVSKDVIEEYISEMKNRGFYDDPGQMFISSLIENDDDIFLTNGVYLVTLSNNSSGLFINISDAIQPEVVQPKDELLVDSNGKQLWKVFATANQMHFKATFTGTGHFSIKLLDSNQDLEELVCNTVGDYIVDKSVNVICDNYYYIELSTTNGTYECYWTGTGGQ